MPLCIFLSTVSSVPYMRLQLASQDGMASRLALCMGGLALIVSQGTQRVAVQVCSSLLLPGFPIAITKLCTVIRMVMVFSCQ
jgi:hypothetical protein